MLSSHLFFCLHLLLTPFTVPCRIVLVMPEDLEMWPYHLSFRFFTMVRRYLCVCQILWNSIIFWETVVTRKIRNVDYLKACIRDLFHVFLNKVKIRLFYVISKPGIKLWLDSICLACLLNTWAVSRLNETGNIVLDLKIFWHPHPNFGIKENRLFCVRKLVI